MGLSVTQLLVAVTTGDGRVHNCTYRVADGAWQPFQAITTLDRPDSLNLNVGANNAWHRVATVDDSLASELRCSYKLGSGWTPALSVATGIGQVRANRGVLATLELLGLGAPETAGWSFGLPVFWVDSGGTIADRKGDAAARLDHGDLDPDDLPVSFDFWGSLGSGGSSVQFFLCLATESGGLYFADVPQSGKGRVTDLKTTGAGDPGFVIGVTCTGPDVFVINDAGKIFHTRRRADGTWLAFGDVNAATHSTESFRQIAIVSSQEVGGSRRRLYLLGVTTTGGLLHAYRTNDDSPDPIWSSFLDVKAAAGNPGSVQSADLAADLKSD